MRLCSYLIAHIVCVTHANLTGWIISTLGAEIISSISMAQIHSVSIFRPDHRNLTGSIISTLGGEVISSVSMAQIHSVIIFRPDHRNLTGSIISTLGGEIICTIFTPHMTIIFWLTHRSWIISTLEGEIISAVSIAGLHAVIIFWPTHRNLISWIISTLGGEIISVISKARMLTVINIITTMGLNTTSRFNWTIITPHNTPTFDHGHLATVSFVFLYLPNKMFMTCWLLEFLMRTQKSDAHCTFFVCYETDVQLSIAQTSVKFTLKGII